MTILEVACLTKVYTTRFAGAPVQALAEVSFSVESGEFLAVMGESGAGKTTLLNILATLDTPTSGQVVLAGVDIATLKDKDVATFRRDNLGFVFQDFNLLDTFTVQDNILLPLVLSGIAYEQMRERLTPLAGLLRITDLLDKYPYEISGGQKQRTAVARALITNPQLVLADEPTGALDSHAAGDLMRLFQQINLAGQTIIMVTHSVAAACHASRVLFIKDGQVFHQLYKASLTNEQMYQRIADTLTMIAAGGEHHV